jgi:hypothetical protein
MLFRFGEAHAAAGFDCYSVDQAGHGESPQPCSLTNILLGAQELERAIGWLSNCLTKKTGENVSVQALIVLPGWFVEQGKGK